MISSISRRLPRLLITIMAIVTVVFIAVRLVPGNPATTLLADYATPELIRQLEQQMGLDKPLPVQYLTFLSQLLLGNLGYSYRSQVPTLDLIAAVYPFTLQLTVIGFLLALVFGIAAGMVAARFHGTWLDLVIMAGSSFWMSMPFFWLGLLLLLLFSVRFSWLPLTGAGKPDDPIDLLRHLLLPAIAVGLREAAIIGRLTRSSVLDILGEDFVRTARAKGLGEYQLLWRHVVRNALPPIIGISAVELIALLGGSIVVEIVFSRPGLGSLFIQSLNARDYPTVQACVLLLGVAVTVVNFVADVAYGAVDPRIGVT